MNALVEQLNERQRRLYAATEVAKRGWGGMRQVREITGISYTAMRLGRAELSAGVPWLPEGRVRADGAGRKWVEESHPGIRAALQELVEEQTAGDPEGGGRWVRASLQRVWRKRVGRPLRPEVGMEAGLAPGVWRKRVGRHQLASEVSNCSAGSAGTADEA